MTESKNQNFNHLKIHSQYSICEGALKIENLKDYTKTNKIKCLGISDTSNLSGALESLKACLKLVHNQLSDHKLTLILKTITVF